MIFCNFVSTCYLFAAPDVGSQARKTLAGKPMTTGISASEWLERYTAQFMKHFHEHEKHGLKNYQQVKREQPRVDRKLPLSQRKQIAWNYTLAEDKALQAVDGKPPSASMSGQDLQKLMDNEIRTKEALQQTFCKKYKLTCIEFQAIYLEALEKGWSRPDNR